MKTLQEYVKDNPKHTYLLERPSYIIFHGMFLFDETAFELYGPFDGNYGYVSIIDGTKWPNLPKEEEYRLKKSHLGFPNGMYKNPPKDKEQLKVRLGNLSEKQLKQWTEVQKSQFIDFPTVERPIQLKVSGNDDWSYSNFFKAVDEAKKQVSEFIEPLNMDVDLRFNGFVFTN